MAGAGDRKTPEFPAYLSGARERSVPKRLRNVDTDERLLSASKVERWPELMADDLLVTVFIVTVGILYMAISGGCASVLLSPNSFVRELHDAVSFGVLAIAYAIIGVLQFIRLFVSEGSWLARAGKMFGPQKHPFEGVETNWLYWIPLGPALLITGLLHSVGVRGRPLGGADFVRPARIDVPASPAEDAPQDDLALRGYSFVVGAFATAFGGFAAWAALNENSTGVEYGVGVFAAIVLLYALLQLNRALGAADTRMARWAEWCGPKQFSANDGIGLIFGFVVWILAIPVMLCLEAVGVVRRQGERTSNDFEGT